MKSAPINNPPPDLTQQVHQIQSVLLAVRTKRLSLGEATEKLMKMINTREDLIFESVRLIVTELERELGWMKEKRGKK